MDAFRIIKHPGSRYVCVSLPFNKSLEVGCQRESGSEVPRSSVNLSLSFTGRDHAGLRFHLQLRRWFFELNICDNRHWDDDRNDWMKGN